MRYFQDADLEELAHEIIEEKFQYLKDGIVIRYLRCDTEKRSNGKSVYADCTKVNDKLREISGADFVITFYADADDITEDAEKILMEHELRHVGWDGEKKFLVPHDIDDFRDIITAYGIDWIKARQTSLFE